MINQTLRNCNVAKLIQILARVSHHRAAAVASVAAYNTASSLFEVAKMECEKARQRMECCVEECKKFETEAKRLAQSTSFPCQQIPGKNFPKTVTLLSSFMTTQWKPQVVVKPEFVEIPILLYVGTSFIVGG
jgi:hypothetical protein